MQYGSSQMMRYRDFVIALHTDPNKRLLGRVAASPVGDTPDFPLYFSTTSSEVEDALASVTYSSGKFLKRSSFSPLYDPIVGIGKQLYQELIHETPIGRSLRQAQEVAKTQSDGLRLRIATDDPELINLPWEFLFDTTQSNYVALSLLTPLVRQFAPQPSLALRPVAAPLRILVVAAEVLDFDAEEEIAALRELEAQSDLLSVQILENATFEQLGEALRTHTPQVVHFIATGAYGIGRGRWSKVRPDDGVITEQGLLFMDKGSRGSLENAEFVPAAQLRQFFQEHASVQFVLLNACDTDFVAAELARVVPAVLGIRAKVLNPTCQALTQGLYEALINGHSLEAAVTAARQAVDRHFPGTREWGLPVFYLNSPHGLLLTPATRAASTALRMSAETATNEAAANLEVAPPTQPTSNQRERQRLRMLLEIEQRNLQSLLNQQATLGAATPPFTLSQIAEAEQKINELENQLQALVP